MRWGKADARFAYGFRLPIAGTHRRVYEARRELSCVKCKQPIPAGALFTGDATGLPACDRCQLVEVPPVPSLALPANSP